MLVHDHSTHVAESASTCSRTGLYLYMDIHVACMHAPAPPTRLTGGGAHAQYMHSTQHAFSNGIEIGSIPDVLHSVYVSSLWYLGLPIPFKWDYPRLLFMSGKPIPWLLCPPAHTAAILTST